MNVLLVLALLAQEAPEEAFRKIEASVAAAKAVRVTFKLSSLEDKKIAGGGSISLEALRSTVELQFPVKIREQRNISMSLTEDRLKIDDGTRPLEGKCDPKMQRANFNAYIGRLGVAMGMAMEYGFRMMSQSKGRWYDPDMGQLFMPLDYKAEGEENGLRIVSYRVKIPVGGDVPFPLGRIKVWYDPRNYSLHRRESEMTLEGRTMTLVETYQKYELDSAAAATPTAPAPPPPPPKLTDEEIDQKFIETKVRIANEHLKAGRRQKAIEALEGVLREFPKHPASAEARKLLEEAKK